MTTNCSIRTTVVSEKIGICAIFLYVVRFSFGRDLFSNFQNLDWVSFFAHFSEGNSIFIGFLKDHRKSGLACLIFRDVSKHTNHRLRRLAAFSAFFGSLSALRSGFI